MRIDIDADLANRLVMAARRLKRDPAECARSAIVAFVQDCEESAQLAARLNGGDHWVRDEDWSD
jgi:predicted transcriptional regulator